MSATRVSIVIPTYKRSHSLERALVALASQSHGAHEILIIDQNAPGWLAGELGHILDGAKVVWTARANASAARNLGFVASTGDVVLFIDDDLVAPVDFLERAVARFEKYSEIGCLCPVIITDNEDLERATRDARVAARRAHGVSPELLAMPSVISAAMFFRRATYEGSGGFDELLFDYARAGEDQELCFRMSKRNIDVWLDASLGIFHDESVPGGCELRTRPFWESRERAIRSNVLRARLHARGHIEWPVMVRLARTAFLNSNMLRNSPRWTFRNARLLVEALGDTGRLLRERGESVADVRLVDHLAPHRSRSPRDSDT